LFFATIINVRRFSAGPERQDPFRLSEPGRRQTVDDHTVEEGFRSGRPFAGRQADTDHSAATQLFAVDRRSVQSELRRHQEDKRNRHRYCLRFIIICARRSYFTTGWANINKTHTTVHLPSTNLRRAHIIGLCLKLFSFVCRMTISFELFVQLKF